MQKEGTDEKITSMKEREGNEKDIKYFEKYNEKINLMNEIMNQRLIWILDSNKMFNLSDIRY